MKKDETFIRTQWGFECIFNSYNSQSRGVAILLNNKFEYKIHKTLMDNNGNLIIVDIEINNKRISLINIYGPNRDSPDFYEQIGNMLKELGNQVTIWTGDFNLVLNPDLDTKNYININNPKAREKVLDLCEEFNSIDVWRESYPEEKNTHGGQVMETSKLG